MENLKENTKLMSDLECDVEDIKCLQDFSDWLEKALELTSSIWGKSSTQYISAKNTKNHYIILPLLNRFDLEEAKNDAYEIIEICNEGLV